VDAFMSILIDYYNRYWGIHKTDEPFVEPSEVLEFSTKKRLESEQTGGLIEYLYDYIPEPEILATYIGNRSEIIKLPTIGNIAKYIVKCGRGVNADSYVKESIRGEGTKSKTEAEIRTAVETFFNIKNIRGLTVEDKDEVYYPIIIKPKSDSEDEHDL
jgi:hypothetical protein